jgi:hypothetical protein
MCARDAQKATKKFKGVGTMALIIVVSSTLVACPPQPPCDEKISDPMIYENLVLSSPIIQQINDELVLRQVTVSPCFVDNKVGVGVLYELPSSYSEYHLVYSDYLNLAYSKDGAIEVSGGIEQPTTFERNAILTYFKGRIQEIESNRRIREVITKTKPDPLNPIIPLLGQLISRNGGNRIEYNFYSGLVRGYILSNDIDWQEFPEIKQAHTVIKEHLLVGSLSGCSIGHGEMHSYTSATLLDFPKRPWYLTVALICDDGWKDATVQINSDGSYERLAIEREYNK